MPKKRKVTVQEEKFVTQTPLQEFASGMTLDIFMVVVIILNCIFIASTDPKIVSASSNAFCLTLLILC
jgi:hypothetical protein